MVTKYAHISLYPSILPSQVVYGLHIIDKLGSQTSDGPNNSIICLCFRPFFSKRILLESCLNPACSHLKSDHFRIFRIGIFASQRFRLGVFLYCLLSYFSSSMNLARIVCLCFRTFFSKKHPRITLITLVCPMPKKQHFRIFRSGIFPARLFSLVMFCPILTIFYLFVVKVRRDLSTVGACVVSIPWGVLALLRYFCSILRYFCHICTLFCYILPFWW